MNDNPLFWNSVAAASLTVLLIFFGLPQLAAGLYGGGGHHGGHGGELHLAYPVEFERTGGGEAAAAAPKADPSPRWPQRMGAMRRLTALMS